MGRAAYGLGSWVRGEAVDAELERAWARGERSAWNPGSGELVRKVGRRALEGIGRRLGWVPIEWLERIDNEDWGIERFADGYLLSRRKDAR